MATYKPGQKVRIVADWSRHEGALGVIEGMDSRRYRVSLLNPPSGEEGYVRTFYRRELAPIEVPGD